MQRGRSQCALHWHLLFSRDRLRDNPGSSARFSWVRRRCRNRSSPCVAVTLVIEAPRRAVVALWSFQYPGGRSLSRNGARPYSLEQARPLRHSRADAPWRSLWQPSSPCAARAEERIDPELGAVSLSVGESGARPRRGARPHRRGARAAASPRCATSRHPARSTPGRPGSCGCGRTGRGTTRASSCRSCTRRAPTSRSSSPTSSGSANG